MKLNTIQHPKLLRLRRRLSVPTWGAVGILESLWHLTAHHAKDGAIGKTFTNEDIANAIGWDGEPDQLIEALVSAGWLDVCEVNRLVVHDWHDHCPEFVRGNIRRMKKEFATGPNTVPNTVPYSVGNTVPYSVPYSVPNTVGTLSTVLQDQDQDQAKTKPEEEKSVALSEADTAPPIDSVAEYPCQGKRNVWHLTVSQVADWQAIYPSLDILAECRKALAWLKANPQKKRTHGGMAKYLVNWLNRAVERPAPAAPTTRPPPAPVRPWSEVFAEQEQAQGRLIDLEVRHG
ncbi:hypothetical protein EBT31_00285 [bacterium]|nr:hypothetical protein [bacterium]